MKIKIYDCKAEKLVIAAQDKINAAKESVKFWANVPSRCESSRESLNAAKAKKFEAEADARLSVKDGADKAEALLCRVNGKATKHTFTSWRDLRAIAIESEKQLVSSGVSLKARVGCTVTATSGGSVASAYKYSRECTRVTLKRGSSGWYLIDASRVSIYKIAPKNSITLTDAAKESVIRSALAPYA